MSDRTKCSNKQRKMETIADCLKKHPEGICPTILAFETGIGHGCIRRILREMKKDCVVRQKYPRGPYYLVQDSTHGIKKDPKFQNITLQCRAKNPIERVKKVYEYKIATLSIESGKKSGKITGRISAEPPLTHREMCLMGDFFISLIGELFGETPDPHDIQVVTLEVNWDYPNMRLEGVSCITLEDLFGLEKVYNREDGVRHEYKVKVALTLKEFRTLLIDGFSAVSVASRIGVLEEGQGGLNEGMEKVIKGLSYLNGLLKSLEAMIDDDKKTSDAHTGD